MKIKQFFICNSHDCLHKKEHICGCYVLRGVTVEGYSYNIRDPFGDGNVSILHYNNLNILMVLLYYSFSRC